MSRLIGYLLQETWFKVLLEDGWWILLEFSLEAVTWTSRDKKTTIWTEETRPIPDSVVWTARDRKTTAWIERDRLAFILQENWFYLLQEDWFKLITDESIYNIWNTPRKSNYLEWTDWINIFDTTWVEILTATWTEVNKIDTAWS